ncbi:AtpZ/AtpI family protein [uncultured Ruthenibacterium sp.]|uniref:AtpZ/AtpI family protein n=1 Tax=uncultured Ruthenibacterium sp. TaxID=1905347 RepID=UPI00349EF6BC
MRKTGWLKVMRHLSWLTQVGFSVSAPLILLLLGAYWLVNKCGWGAWVYIVAIILGIGAGASSFAQFAGFFKRQINQSQEQNDDSQRKL